MNFGGMTNVYVSMHVNDKNVKIKFFHYFAGERPSTSMLTEYRLQTSGGIAAFPTGLSQCGWQKDNSRRRSAFTFIPKHLEKVRKCNAFFFLEALHQKHMTE